MVLKVIARGKHLLVSSRCFLNFHACFKTLRLSGVSTANNKPFYLPAGKIVQLYKPIKTKDGIETLSAE
ncbi:MAG: hypothetical protein C4589_01140 [Peptococcaceae bacterium]|nr:MAG: hypothetical protein C4589_01140 [Peptococcaceae bacterium]